MRTLRLLQCLAERPGQVVSIDDLLNQAWAGVAVSPDSVYQAVASLRRLLGDDPKQPRYIETVPRLGYRMVAAVSPFNATDGVINSSVSGLDIANADSSPSASVEPSSAPAEPAARGRRRLNFWWIAASICLALAITWAFLPRTGAANKPTTSASTVIPQRSVAVLPFLDLTEGMKEEEFADGMTEELIDRLIKVPGLRVPPPTSSFYFKNKQVPVAEIARSLGVAYVLDGSVRKSGGRVRIAARLIRADNGAVVWSESYERPFGDILMVQDEIAGKVTKALEASIAGQAAAGSSLPQSPR